MFFTLLDRYPKSGEIMFTFSKLMGSDLPDGFKDDFELVFS